MSILNNQDERSVESENSSVDGIIVDIPINIPSADDGVIDESILRIAVTSAVRRNAKSHTDIDI